MCNSSRLAGALLVLVMAASVGSPQAAPPVITSTTRLVQVSVIAKEKGGEPAAGLKAEDFRVLVDGRPQKISFFSAESTGVAATSAALPPGTFSNILAARGQAINGITVVLLDLVNTRMVDRMYARQQLIKYLEQIQPQDRIGVYVFGGRLRVLHEYTADMADFQRKLADAKSRLISVSGTETPGALDREQSEFDAAFAGRGGNLVEREFYMRNRVMGTLAVFKFLANHLEKVPGRKNLIWVSGAFPMIFGYQTMDNMAENYTEEVDATVRALSQANVAVYPIDARGLTTPPGFDASRGSGSASTTPARSGAVNRPATAPPRPGGGSNRREIAAHATMDEIAQRTGGHAYYNTNDIARAIHEAVADSTLTYTIGFYPTDEKNDRDFHKIKIETAQRHVSLHYRSGYLDLPLASQDERQRMLQLHDALFSPLDATELGLTVHAARATGATALDLVVTVQPDGVRLKQEGDRYDGRLDMLIAQLDSRGNFIEGSADTHDTVEMKMLADTYKKFTADGLPIRKTLTPSPRADTLRIVVRDAGSGMIGSLTVPLKGL
ncbi:MAG TPA: VWA domain-containing protein [Bryobacteraceae bacterium]|nr:VWA domain-containing protein [Bryobacteraceae bacterium]